MGHDDGVPCGTIKGLAEHTAGNDGPPSQGPSISASIIEGYFSDRRWVFLGHIFPLPTHHSLICHDVKLSHHVVKLSTSDDEK